jgi:hypothetical protein
VFQELLKLVMDCVTHSDTAKDIHIAESTAAKLGIELLYVRFPLYILSNNLKEM